MNFFRVLQVAALLCATLAPASMAAAGPRWVAGAKWTNDSHIMNWYRPGVQYFVDSGPLSASVNNAAATALVDAAAAVWTVNGIPFSLRNGGMLNEDVDGSNVYLGANGPVWPTDVQSSNYTAVQIAVVFDADGSITDTLLGSGASAPGNCRTAAVTESVDLFIAPGKIAHAIVVLNGRCTGSAPEQQLQLRYQLMRVFGRVIGIGWSQLNDNVFTGTPAPQYADQMHWPIMHPIDILCGLYSYQCLPQPFTLRDDDTAALSMVYSTQLNQSNPGKVSTSGWLRFPSGQGMNGVNLVAHRSYPNDGYGTESYGTVSGVSGFLAPGDFGNPVTGPPADADDKQGGSGGFAPGYFILYGVPSLTQFAFTSLEVITEPINPLYTGAYAVGPYRVAAVAPGGDALQFTSYGNAAGAVSGGDTFVPANAPYLCAGGADGAENAPVALSDEGIWSGLFCGVRHSSWTGFAVRAGRSATIEVTAVDGTEAATTSKAMPVIGVWHASDPTGTLPTLAQASAFNSTRLGMTQLRVAFSMDEQVRLAVADGRGDGRPDYLYRARVLYADAVTPTRLPPAGGSIRILGRGFQTGSTVTVGGVVAAVTSQSTTEIDAIAPTAAALGGTAINDVVVTDPRTAGSTRITGALTYTGAASDTLSLVSAPPSSVSVGASAVFAVRLLDSSGAAAANSSITVSASGGQVQFAACNLSTCTLLTDSSGLAQTRLTPGAAGSVTLQAVARSGSSVQAAFVAVQSVQSITLLRPLQYIAAGPGAVFHPAVLVLGADASSVSWSSLSPLVALGAVHSTPSTSQVDATASLRDGETTTVQACTAAALCATENLQGVAAADLRVINVAGDLQSIVAAAGFQAVIVRVVDSAGHAVAGAGVVIHQRVTGLQPPCPATGRCPAPPVYSVASTVNISDDDGLITVLPTSISGVAGTTQVTVTAGTAGVLTVTLQKTL
ncbi:MAG: IPT/TIG domain-containing protein [Janthinobacterium lividum]